MKRILLAVLAAAALTLSAGAADAAQARVQVGRLSCNVDGGIGYIIGSQKDVTCKFIRKGAKTETYRGTISKLGLDIGFTKATHIEWLVFSGSVSNARRHALAGTYVGATAEATLGVGLGANWLIGGSKKGFALQPFSVQGQTGISLTYAFAGLTLR